MIVSKSIVVEQWLKEKKGSFIIAIAFCFHLNQPVTPSQSVTSWSGQLHSSQAFCDEDFEEGTL